MYEYGEAMKHLPTELLYLLKIYNYIMYEIGLDSARSRAEEIRAYIDSCTFLKDHPGLYEYLSPDKSMEDIITYIKRNEKTYDMLSEWKDGECSSLFEAKGLENYLDRAVICSYELSFKRTDTNDAFLEFDGGDLSTTKLILEGAQLSDDITVTDGVLWYEFYRRRDGKLSFELFTDSLDTVKLDFDDFRCERVFYNATEAFPFWDNPYELLCDMSSVIYEKKLYDASLLTNEEGIILPVVEFLHFLNMCRIEDASKEAVAAFRSLLQEYGLKKQDKLLVKLLKKKKFSVYSRNKLISSLSLAECESLWRRLYGDICNSQKNVPHSPEYERQKNQTELKDEITALLRAQGYEGIYPNFYKKGEVRGIHAASSYGLDYFIANEKNAYFTIRPHITIDVLGETVVTFLCGTVFLRKNDSLPEDAFSSLFNAKGKRFFKYTHLQEVTDGDVAKAVQLAVKRAEMKKLKAFIRCRFPPLWFTV